MSGEHPRSRGHDLVVPDVAQVLADVPAVPEGIIELPVAIPQNIS
jgi:hypothetical protein